MPQQKLTIVPVSLHSDQKWIASPVPSSAPSASICTIKTANVEISFYNGAEERMIQAVMKELRQW